MSEASEADVQEQQLPAVSDEEPELLPQIDLDPEVPEADAIEQALPAPVEDDAELR